MSELAIYQQVISAKNLCQLLSRPHLQEMTVFGQVGQSTDIFAWMSRLKWKPQLL
jgi:hypothetical protein